MAQRVTFYIDGFNFYYGLRRTKRNEPQWGDYYWIDMVKLCQGFLGEGQEVEKVIYFTASPLNPEKSSRQSAFLNANKLINGESFEVVRGKYLDKNGAKAYRRNIRMGRQNPQYYEVLEGQEPGERVVTSGYEVFKDNEVLVIYH